MVLQNSLSIRIVRSHDVGNKNIGCVGPQINVYCKLEEGVDV
jgi:hypothetical protein